MENLVQTSQPLEAPETTGVVGDTRVEFYVTGDDITATNDATYGTPDLTLTSQEEQFSLNGTFIGRTNAGAEGELVTGVVTGNEGVAMDEAERERFNRNRTALSEYDMAISSAIASLEQRMAAHSEYMDGLAFEFDTNETRINEIDVEIASIDEQIVAAETELTTEQEGADWVDEQIAAIEEEQVVIEDDLEGETQQLEVAEDNMEESRDDLTEARTELNDAEATTEAAEERLEEALDNPDTDEREIEILEEDLSRAESAESIARTEYTTSLNGYVEDAQDVAEIRTTISTLEGNRAENDVTLGELRQERDERQIRIDQLEADIAAFNEEKGSLESEGAALVARQDALTTEMAQVQAEMDEMGTQLETLNNPDTSTEDLSALLRDLRFEQDETNARIMSREADSSELAELEIVLASIADNPELQARFENGEITRADILIMVQESTGGPSQVLNELIIDNHNAGYQFTEATEGPSRDTAPETGELEITPRTRSIQTTEEDEPELGAALDGTPSGDEFQTEAPVAKAAPSFDPNMYRESAMELLNDKLAFAFDEARDAEPDNFVEVLPEADAEPAQPENFVEVRNAEPVAATPNAP